MTQFDPITQALIDAAPAPEILAKSTRMLARGELDGLKLDMSTFGEETECGTTLCLAGNAALQAGFTPVGPKNATWWALVKAPGSLHAYPCDAVGQVLLGLTNTQTVEMFYTDVENMLRQLDELYPE